MKAVEASVRLRHGLASATGTGNSIAWWHDGVMRFDSRASRLIGLSMVASGIVKPPEAKVTVHQTRAGGGFFAQAGE